MIWLDEFSTIPFFMSSNLGRDFDHAALHSDTSLHVSGHNNSGADLKFIGHQKWDANLSPEDSLIALDLMERLGFERRTAQQVCEARTR